MEGPSAQNQLPTKGIICFTYANALEAGFYFFTGELYIHLTKLILHFLSVESALRSAWLIITHQRAQIIQNI